MGSGVGLAKSSVRDGGRGASPSPPERALLSADEVVAILRALGVLVYTEDLVSIEWPSRDVVVVTFAKNGAAFQVALTKRGDRWVRTHVTVMR